MSVNTIHNGLEFKIIRSVLYEDSSHYLILRPIE